MVQSLKLGGSGHGDGSTAKPGAGIRRLNRLPIIIAIALTVAFLAVIFFGLTSRGLISGGAKFGHGSGGIVPLRAA